MSFKRVLEFDRPRLFSPAFTRRAIEGDGIVLRKNASELVDSNNANTASFRYDSNFVGIRSTQQIPVDFSRFENHVFFNSAEVAVNVAFDSIINGYPFDGTRKEVESFLDSLTGFEKWVLDSFPTNVGYLNFSGSSSPSPSEGTYIEVKDFAGYLFPNISKKRTGDNVIDPVLKPISIEMQLYLPGQTNDNQVVWQKVSGSDQGITLAVSHSNSAASCSMVFAVISSSQMLSASMSVNKGQFNHIVATFDRRPGVNDLKLYLNEALAATSSNASEMGQITFPTSPVLIGSGTSVDRMHSNDDLIPFVPQQTLSGAIDELRVFHGVRSIKQQQLFGRKMVFASPELKLYFKFNEPTGSIGTNNIVLDYSGNSLHSNISNYGHALRSTGSIAVPMLYEKQSFHPVLFPTFPAVQALNVELLASASDYDAVNPNLITKLVPSHYFLEGQHFEGLQDEEGTIGDEMDGGGQPGTMQLGSAQLLASFLYVWAKFFDELKMMLDLFGSVIHVDYDKPGFTADQFLPFLARYYGFDMPSFFTDSSIEQFIDAENVSHDVGNVNLSLQHVQNQIWRRILTNIGDIIRSKGTLYSIKSLLRSMGVDPDGSGFRIREFGGPKFRVLEDARDSRSDVTTLLDFSGSMAAVADHEDVDAQGVHASKPFLRSPFLSGSRVEPGEPAIRGSFVQTPGSLVNVSDDPSDGLFTSGSWTFEGLYRFPTLVTGSHAVSQSLVRMVVTGSTSGPAGSGGLLSNVVVSSGSDVTLYVSPMSGSSNVMFTLPLTGADVMDGRLWNVSFGRQSKRELDAPVSSSYFVRAARQEFGEILESYVTSSLFNEQTVNAFETTGSFNVSGSFFVIGSQSIDTSGFFLNNSSFSSDARTTDFDGRLGQLRFWSKALSVDEWHEHVRNPRSLGVLDPKLNFNFVTAMSGSFQRLMIDASMEQVTSMSTAAGAFDVFDFSQNELHPTSTGFEASKNVLTPQRMFFSQLSPRFDEAASFDKVRVRSFTSFENVELYGGEVAPVYELPRAELPTDDVRFSIDFSIMNALDDDIIKIFSTLDELDNALGRPELMFATEYPDLSTLRDVYFNRLTGSVRLRKFFEFFKWFDAVLGVSTLIEQLLPRKTLYRGVNFVLESHMLERAKVEYLSTDIYLGDNIRHSMKGSIAFQILEGRLRRF